MLFALEWTESQEEVDKTKKSWENAGNGERKTGERLELSALFEPFGSF
ncbi:hypothetical protein J7L68_04035 [bacterium]|nr:hypothetical protein [bacterium]